MSVNVLRLNVWIDPCFDDILAREPGVEVSVMDLHAEEELNWAVLAQTDIYHVSAAKDEVPLKWQVTRELIARCPRLKVVSSTGSGYDTIDVDACTEAGILVVNQSGGNANSVAQHTFALLLSLMNRVVESDQALRKKTGLVREDLMGRELTGKVMGIVGIGHIGTRVARLASAFGMQVLAFDPYLDETEIRVRGASPVSLEELLASSDVVSVHCPRNAETLGMFGLNEFKTMKRGACFLSTARGGIHDENALYTAMQAGHIAGAGLDVWVVEPPPKDHPLLSLPNVVATYHTAGVTHEARRNIAAISAQQILDICAGRTPPRMINPLVYPRVAGRF
jgi:Phosphoglycerate dehydrogenase and related dehydrogenases